VEVEVGVGAIKFVPVLQVILFLALSDASCSPVGGAVSNPYTLRFRITQKDREHIYAESLTITKVLSQPHGEDGSADRKCCEQLKSRHYCPAPRRDSVSWPSRVVAHRLQTALGPLSF
jgi:hypothetical protein